MKLNMLKGIVIVFAGLSMLSCEKKTVSNNLLDNGGRAEFANSDINAFIYYGLDAVYLYKDEQSLFDSTFEDVNAQDDPILSPEDFFEKMTVAEDRFSFIVDDYEDLENNFAGINLSDGIDYRLLRTEEDPTELIGVVYYVDKNSAGAIAGVQRGDFFTTVNGEQLTEANYIDVLFTANSYEVDLLTLDTDTGEFSLRASAEINKFQYTEDPILESKVIDYEGLKIGYLLYNSFIAGSESALNDEFARFQAAGLDAFILDLRYNGGGRVSTAIDLAGMITGQFNDEILILEQWNEEFQDYFLDENPERLYSRFRDQLTQSEVSLNSLNLEKVYILSSKNGTASASELVINGLDAYIDVVHVGDPTGTVGKSQASVTLYDSPNLLDKEDINTAHKYAMQPLIYRSANADGFSVPNEGLIPDVLYTEDYRNLGQFGEVDEPLLQAALNDITGTSVAAKRQLLGPELGKTFMHSKEKDIMYHEMYE